MGTEQDREGAVESSDASSVVGVEQLISAIEQLALARDLPQLTAIVRSAARRLAAADGATFVLRDHGHSYYVDEDAIAPLWKGKRFPLEACVSGWSMIERKVAIIPDIYADPRVPVEAYQPTFVRSMVMVPIRRAEPVGAIGIYWSALQTPSEMQVRLLSALADSTSVAMENIRVYGELEARVRERTGQLEAANRELSAFADSVSHDLKAPLRRILGFSAALSDEYAPKLDGAAREYLRFIAAGATSMTQMVDALLELSRFSQTELACSETELSSIAESIVAELRRDEPGRAISIEIEAGLVAHADPNLARIVLANLLRNAWKFTHGKPDAKIAFGCLVAEAHEVSEQRRERVFYVRDNGAGFRMDYAHDLFLPFRRLHSKHEFPGNGIGLATVQRIVNRHGGKVWADGAEGQGATFFWTFSPPPARVSD
jgi:signal transduction histidine kinase